MPDEREIGGCGPDIRASNRVAFVVVTMIVAMLAMVVFAFIEASKFEAGQRKFMAACIEFHSVDRCTELDRYGRRDLGLK